MPNIRIHGVPQPSGFDGGGRLLFPPPGYVAPPFPILHSARLEDEVFGPTRLILLPPTPVVVVEVVQYPILYNGRLPDEVFPNTHHFRPVDPYVQPPILLRSERLADEVFPPTRFFEPDVRYVQPPFPILRSERLPDEVFRLTRFTEPTIRYVQPPPILYHERLAAEIFPKTKLFPKPFVFIPDPPPGPADRLIYAYAVVTTDAFSPKRTFTGRSDIAEFIGRNFPGDDAEGAIGRGAAGAGGGGSPRGTEGSAGIP